MYLLDPEYNKLFVFKHRTNFLTKLNPVLKYRRQKNSFPSIKNIDSGVIDKIVKIIHENPAFFKTQISSTFYETWS